ncbi:MAG: glycoside hydrolase family 43 protein [Puniceicoccaceae bacterium]
MKSLIVTLLGLLSCAPSCLAVNPIIQTLFTADPAPMVYNDKVYLYTTHDEDGSTWFTMKDWRVYSSDDMVNWTDHGSPLSLDDFSWASKDAWAAQCIERNGKFYFYICAHHTELNRMAIGVAVSDSPTGPFVPPFDEPLVAAHWGDIDPTVFIDDDGQAYLYWGNPHLWYVKLNEDMISYDRELGVVQVPLTQEGFHTREEVTEERPSAYEEGPWLYKREELYYMLYPAGGVPEHLAYSYGPSATGPWQYGGVIMEVIEEGGAFTNHPGLIEYKGNAYLFYHNGALPGGGGFNRSVCVEPFEFNADGSIPLIEPTREGVVEAVAWLNPYRRVEAETIAWTGGVETERDAQVGMVVTDIDDGDFIRVRSVDLGEGPAQFTASIAAAESGGSIEIRLDSRDGTLIGTCSLEAGNSPDDWVMQSCDVAPITGVHDLYFVFEKVSQKQVRFDFWKFSKQG